MMTPERFEEVAGSIDYHLNKLYNLQYDLHDFKSTMRDYVNSERKELLWEISQLRSMVSRLEMELQKRGLPKNEEYETQYRELKDQINNIPQAVNPENICNTQELKELLAERILTLVVGQDLKGLNFLDYGCGENLVIKNCNAEIAVGYDIKNNEGVVTDFKEVKKNQYDLILMHDVLDHIEGMTPVDALKQAKSVLKGNGKIIVKNHPWCSRHGGHLYEQINKAYLHLIFDERELVRIGGYQSTPNQRVIDPINQYAEWFDKAGFDVLGMQINESPVEDYFLQPSHARNRLLTYWGNNESKMIKNMEIEFIEYTLKIKKQAIF